MTSRLGAAMCQLPDSSSFTTITDRPAFPANSSLGWRASGAGRAVAGAVGVLMRLCACPASADDVADFYKGKTLTIVVGPRSANRLRHLRPYSCPSSRTSYPWQTIGCSAPADLHW